MMDYNDGLLPEPCLRMDTHFGDDYESVEFGDGTGYVKAVPMLARLGALHVELDELRDALAKLRELVADMWPFVEGAMDDEYCPAPECPFTELCTENQVCMVSSGFHYRMRELGVEA